MHERRSRRYFKHITQDTKCSWSTFIISERATLYIPAGTSLGRWKHKKAEDGADQTTQRWHRTRLLMAAFGMEQVNILQDSITLELSTFSSHFKLVLSSHLKMRTTVPHRLFRMQVTDVRCTSKMPVTSHVQQNEQETMDIEPDLTLFSPPI
jgi:hypothetical protein